MRVSSSWLKEYIKTNLFPEKIAEILTNLGLEVEEIIDRGKIYEGLIVAEVIEVKKHPNGDSLSLVTIDTGSAKERIVCGAPNVISAKKVVYAPQGTNLPNGLCIEKTIIRGEPSNGMLCSADELGWQKERAAGIIILPEDAPLGDSLVSYLKLEDKILLLSLTPNLGHAASMIGVARELAAATGEPLEYPKLTIVSEDKKIEEIIKVTIEDAKLCPRYTVRVVSGVTVEPSPLWMQQRLLAAGVRPINNIVDITNYVMLEYGQPLHAFDLDKIKGDNLVIRPAKEGESFVTLDGKIRNLGLSDLVIADAEGAICLAGVMGGERTEVTPKTKNILLEVANFQQSSVARAVKKFNLASESSYRFERGVDIERVLEVGLRASLLMTELAGGEPIGKVADIYPHPHVKRNIQLRVSRVNRVLGTSLAPSEISSLLKRLNYSVEDTKNKDVFLIEVPSSRNDIEMEVDLIEEVARLYGYNAIPASLPTVGLQKGEKASGQKMSERISESLTQLGFNQMMTLPLVPKDENIFSDCQGKFQIMNPLNEEQGALRNNLQAGLIRSLQFNVKRSAQVAHIYEIGKIFKHHEDEKRPSEETNLALAVMGAKSEEPWTKEAPSFFALKGALEIVFTSLNLSLDFQKSNLTFLHPGRQAEIFVNGLKIGYIGELHPVLQDSLDLPQRVAISEISMESLQMNEDFHAIYRGVPRYPAISRDLAFIIEEDVPARDLEGLLKDNAGPYLERLTLFDFYNGEQIPEGKKSLAYNFLFRHKQKTLTDNEVEVFIEKIISEAQNKYQASLRG